MWALAFWGVLGMNRCRAWLGGSVSALAGALMVPNAHKSVTRQRSHAATSGWARGDSNTKAKATRLLAGFPSLRPTIFASPQGVLLGADLCAFGTMRPPAKRPAAGANRERA